MNDFVLYVKESYNELVHNVTWPSWGDLMQSGVVVIIGSIIFALIVFILDKISFTGLSFLYEMGQ